MIAETGLTVLLSALLLVIVQTWNRLVSGRKRLPSALGVSKALSARRTALVTTLGHKPDLVYSMVNTFRPECVGVLHTDDEEAKNALDEVEEFLKQKKIEFKPQPVSESDVGSIERGAEVLFHYLISTKKYERHEVVLDLTLGTSAMSVGAFVVAERWQIESQYVSSKWRNWKDRVPVPKDVLILYEHYADKRAKAGYPQQPVA